ncbi:MAG: gluconate 2-dehydrogenase subunit 3 family protein [Gemmatimonadales bacterium]
MNRREVVKLLAVAPLAVAFTWTAPEIDEAWRLVRLERRFQPRFFTPHEWETVRLLADLILPRDERSGSATDAGVAEVIDFLMADRDDERRQTAMRGGLAWVDSQCRERFGQDFLDCADAERRALLDLIAWPAKAPAELSHGVEFFNSFRNLTASGFWSSKMGVRDLQYIGNRAIAEWRGCPEEQLRKLGLQQ